MSTQLDGEKCVNLTLAEQESLKSHNGRKSQRYGTCQKIKTSRLRRVQELFWKDDVLYSSKQNMDNQKGGPEIEEAAEGNANSGTNSSSSNEKKNILIEERSRVRNLTAQLNEDGSTINFDESTNAALTVVEYNFGGRLRLKRIHDSPHVYTIDNFLTPKEMLKIQDKIEIADREKLFSKSFVDGGGINDIKRRKRKHEENDIDNAAGTAAAAAEKDKSADEAKIQRTSTFIHFSKLSNSSIAAIENRAADLLSMPNHSIEPLQLVRYSRGQYFHDHHDMGMLFEDGSVELPTKNAMTAPRRIVTILVYLNDLPNDVGGSTHFPLLKAGSSGSDTDVLLPLKGLSIRPKKNLAVIFCNVKKDGTPDERLVHRGETLKGDSVKYAMNIWACED